MRKFILKQNGIGGLESLIFVTAFLTLGFGLMQFVNHSLRAQKNVESRQDIESRLNDFLVIAGDASTCKSAFRIPVSSPVPNSPYPVVTFASGSPPAVPADINLDHISLSTSQAVDRPIISKGTLLNSNSTITLLTLKANPSAAPVFQASSTIYKMQLEIKAKKNQFVTGNTTNNPDVVVRSPDVIVTVDSATRQISSCFLESGGGNEAMICAMLGGSMVDGQCVGHSMITGKTYKTNTYILWDRYWLYTPVVCPVYYALNACGSLYNNTNRYVCYAYPGCGGACSYKIDGIAGITQAEFALNAILQLHHACHNYCAGPANGETGNNISGLGVGPGQTHNGSPFTTGRFVSCGGSLAAGVENWIWSEIFCECVR